MAEPGEDGCFFDEAATCVRRSGPGLEDLEGDAAADGELLGFEDGADAAFSQRPDQPVFIDRGADVGAGAGRSGPAVEGGLLEPECGIDIEGGAGGERLKERGDLKSEGLIIRAAGDKKGGPLLGRAFHGRVEQLSQSLGAGGLHEAGSLEHGGGEAWARRGIENIFERRARGEGVLSPLALERDTLHVPAS